MRDTISRMKLHFLLPLMLLFGMAAVADDGCGMWAHPEPTGDISCDWYNIDGSGWEYICLNDWQCVNDGCESVGRPGEKTPTGSESGVTPADNDRKIT